MNLTDGGGVGLYMRHFHRWSGKILDASFWGTLKGGEGQKFKAIKGGTGGGLKNTAQTVYSPTLYIF